MVENYHSFSIGATPALQHLLIIDQQLLYLIFATIGIVKKLNL